MKILTVISRLLEYPELPLVENRDLLLDVVAQSPLPAKNREGIAEFINRRCAGDLLDWQEEYDSFFERGRSLSLLIFEHIHGESRDRGQAMVELLGHYKAAGLDISEHELPDHLPLYLEFAATQGEYAVDWLSNIAPVLGVLAVRLNKRSSNYAELFNALLALSGDELNLGDLAEQVEKEKPDYTPKALDKVWEEEAVTFGGDAINGGCPSQTNRPSDNQRRDRDVPIGFVDAPPSSRSATH